MISHEKKTTIEQEQINELKKCITHCEAKLKASYIKALEKLKKQNDIFRLKMTQLKEKLAMAKKKHTQAKSQLKSKKTAVNTKRFEKTKTTLHMYKQQIEQLEAEQKALKNQMSHLENEYKKWIAKEKALVQFEKAWEKLSTKKAHRIKSKNRIQKMSNNTQDPILTNAMTMESY